MFINFDFSDLLKIFRDNNVKYLVIGGYAVVQHATPCPLNLVPRTLLYEPSSWPRKRHSPQRSA